SITKPAASPQILFQGASRVVDELTQTVLLGPDKTPLRGIGAGEYQLDEDAAGGEYTLTVGEAYNRFPPQERKFIVNRYQKPRLNKDLEFTRKSYGPGDEVAAACKAVPAEGGGSTANKPVKATLKIDGQEVAKRMLRTDTTGAVSVKFQLPPQMERGDGTLAVAFTDGGSYETLARPIPIVLKKLQVEFFPDGGDLVAGMPNGVYFQARTTLDKPAELTGRVVDDQGKVLAHVQTLNDPTQPGANQGMGRFEFTPQAGRQYELKIDSPSG